MRRFGLVLAALLCLGGGVALADDFTLPGLEADSSAYAQTLTSRFPAGGTPQARKAAEQAAATAIRKPDWAAAAAAWETRIALGDAKAGAMAVAGRGADAPYAARSEPRASQAAWQNFSSSEPGAAEVPSLLLMAEALKALDRPAQAIQALEAAAERAPDDKTIVQRLDETRRATGILVRRVATEAEADPPRACIDFTVAPARRDDFHAEDWARLDPPVAGRRGHPRGRPDLHLRTALGRHHADHAARRDAGRVRPQPGQGHQPRHRHGQPPPAHRLRHAHVPAAARPDAGDRTEHGQPVHRRADARTPHRTQRRRLRAQREAWPAGRYLGCGPHRRTDRTHRLARQRRHPEMAAQPQRTYRAADARRAGRIRARASTR